MKVKAEELLKALETVKPALAQKDIVPEMTHFVFDGNYLSAYDDKISISVEFQSDQTFCVKGDDLFNIISKLNKEKEVTITKKKDKVTVKQGRRSATLATSEGTFINEYIESVHDSISEEFSELPEDFVKGLSMCYPCASGDASSGVFNCVSVENNRILSSDRNRIGVYYLGSDIDEPFLIKASAVHKLVNYEITHYLVADKWVHFLTENDIIFSIRKVDAEDGFPDFIYLIEQAEKAKNKIDLPEEMKDMIDFASIMSEADVYYKKAFITIDGDKLTVKCKTKERGSAIASTKLKKSSKKKIEFVINPTFLLYTIGLAKSIKVDGKKALLTAGDFKYLVALFGDD